jgi:CBS domain-containing protein
MFSVYGASGRLFRGTLEQLRQIGPVHAVDRTRALEPVARDGRSGVPAAPGDSGLPHGDAYRAAREAYASPAVPPGQRWGLRTAASVMNPEVLILRDTDAAASAWRALEQHHYGQAPVVNADGVLVGLVTLARLARLVTGSQFEERGSLAVQPLAACMLTPVPSVAAGADLRRVAGLLLESELPALPVVDDAGRVQGLVARTDILRAVLDDTAVDQWG